jgi:capsular exopolysaccharide synthesis family protein
MSRVDEALRRAAEEARLKGTAGPDRVNGAAAPGRPIGMDVAEFADHGFPVESAEPESPHAAAPGRTDEPIAHEPIERKPVMREPLVADPSGTSAIFEHLDQRLAAKVVIDRDMMQASREQYRRLAATLHHRQASDGLKVVMITSAMVGEGKTLTASNLALTLSESYQRSVLLMDADLRRPSIHTVFGISGMPGLSDGLESVDEEKLQVHQVSRQLTILPAGRAVGDPMAALTSPRMRRLIEEARESFGWVIIDTPPVALLTDANLLASMVDGALLVVRAGSTPYPLTKRAVTAIGADRILGVVLNRVGTTSGGMGGYGYGYGYSYYDHYDHYRPSNDAKS